jgi:hypothetical protein
MYMAHAWCCQCAANRNVANYLFTVCARAQYVWALRRALRRFAPARRSLQHRGDTLMQITMGICHGYRFSAYPRLWVWVFYIQCTRIHRCGFLRGPRNPSRTLTPYTRGKNPRGLPIPMDITTQTSVNVTKTSCALPCINITLIDLYSPRLYRLEPKEK